MEYHTIGIILQYSLIYFNYWKVCSNVPSFIPDFSNLSLLSLFRAQFTECLILLIVQKRFSFSIFAYSLLISTLIFSYILLTLGSVCSSSSSFLKGLGYWFEVFLNTAFITINFLRIAVIAPSKTFDMFVFIFIHLKVFSN